MGTVPPFSELITATASSAVHLEMRDAYTPDDQRFLDWLAGKPLPCPANPAWSQLVPGPYGQSGAGCAARTGRFRT